MRGHIVKRGKDTHSIKLSLGKDQQTGKYKYQWVRDYCKPNLAPRTTEGYRYIIKKYIVPALGQIPLTQLKPEHLQHLYSENETTRRTT